MDNLYYPGRPYIGIMLCPNGNAVRSQYNWQVSQSVLHPTESTAESQRSWQLQTFHRRLGEPPLLWGMLMGRLKVYAETSMPALGLRRCPGPAPSEKARWPRESTISSSPRCERCRYHARLHPLHRGFHWVGAPGYGELAVTDGFVAGGADGQWLELGAAGVLEDDRLGSGVDVFARPIL